MRLIDADELRKHKFKSASERVDLSVPYMGGWNDAIDSIVVNAPTIEAIPIDWILNNKRLPKDGKGLNAILDMIEDWREKNADDSD